jgi:hypothetical protein
MIRTLYIVSALAVLFSTISCSYSKEFPRTYYAENSEVLQSIKQRYKQNYNQHPFSLEIRDKAFEQLGLEMILDTIRYIYSFQIKDPSLADTLHRYGYKARDVLELIHDMQQVQCTWLNNLDYYENLEKKYLVFLSIRHRKLESVWRKDRYFTLAFFDTPQPFDEKGRLLDRKNRKQLRKINGAVFYKIDDRTGYALTTHFR